MFFSAKTPAQEADVRMAVEYRASTTNMDIDDCKIAYKQFFSEEKFLTSGNKWTQL